MIETVTHWAVMIAQVLLFLGIALAFVRLTQGPTLPDRVVALDLISIQMVAFMALFTVISGKAVFLDVAAALALVAFLATVAFARFVERRNKVHDEEVGVQKPAEPQAPDPTTQSEARP